ALESAAASEPGAAPASAPAPEVPALEVVRRLVAERAELPPAAVDDASRLLGDLHLNSIVVGQIAAEASKRLGLPSPADPTAYAGATVAELAKALEALVDTRGGGPAAVTDAPPGGIDAWVRPFALRWVERAAPSRGSG